MGHVAADQLTVARPTGLSDYADVGVHAAPLGTFVSLYSGAGGLDIGFALAGFAPVWVNDLDSQAIDTHERMQKRLRDERPHLHDVACTTIAGSILDLQAHDLLPGRGSADLVIGGPPCQGFSVAGKMDPLDRRSEHVFRFLDVVARVRPRAFVMENVKALYENRRWAGIRDALRQRAELLGYSTEIVLLNAAHFGVPQARERMVLMGSLDGTPKLPVPTTADNPPTIRQAFAQLPPFGMPGNDSLCAAKITTAKIPVLRKSPFAGMLFNGAGRPMDVDSPALTLPASMGGNKTAIVDQQQLDTGSEPWIISYHRHLMSGGAPWPGAPSYLRRLTVEEASVLQTFPLGMDWAGPQSSQYRQIGNAVPPRLALAVAEAIKATLSL